MWWVTRRSCLLGLVVLLASCYLISKVSYLFETKPSLQALRREVVVVEWDATESSRVHPGSEIAAPTPKIESQLSNKLPADSRRVLSETLPEIAFNRLPRDFDSIPQKTCQPLALSLNYWEQTANALMNLFDLQCWAGTVNISGVVEPSILRHWGKGVFHTLSSKHSEYTFGDLFDLDHWNRMSLKYGVSPLVSLENFFQDACRDVVYVQIIYHRLEHKEDRHCRSLYSVAGDGWAQLLRSKGFRLVKTVCIDFSMNPTVSEEEFRESIFTSEDHPMSVLFSRFRGISPLGKGARLVMTGPLTGACARKLTNFNTSTLKTSVKYPPLNSSSEIVPSKRIVDLAKQFILEKMSGKKYIAVMLRTERLKKLLPMRIKSEVCASDVISDWEEMVARNDIHKTLFFSDIGGHGSLGWSDNHRATEFSKRIEGSIDLELSPALVNSVLEEMTGSKDSVQMAALHQQLVVHAMCVVVVGGGRFQSQTLNMYFHSHKQQECYSYRDEFCNSSYISQIYGF